MVNDPGIEKRHRVFLQDLSRGLVSAFSSYESLVRSKDSKFEAKELSCDQRIYDLGPWMMDFSALGIRTRFDDYKKPYIESFVNLIRATLGKNPVGSMGSMMNQYARDLVILPVLDRVFLEVLKDRKDLRFLDNFCAEGFYTYYGAQFDNVGSTTGVELDPRQLVRANAINELFSLSDKVEFHNKNVFDIEEEYDVSLCMGGLYHLDNPSEFVDLLSELTKDVMIIHTVIAWDGDEDFIITPAPGWQHGSRFSYKFIRKHIEKNGWRIANEGTQIYPATFNNYWSSKAAWFLCLR